MVTLEDVQTLLLVVNQLRQRLEAIEADLRAEERSAAGAAAPPPRLSRRG